MYLLDFLYLRMLGITILWEKKNFQNAYTYSLQVESCYILFDNNLQYCLKFFMTKILRTESLYMLNMLIVYSLKCILPLLAENHINEKCITSNYLFIYFIFLEL